MSERLGEEHYGEEGAEALAEPIIAGELKR
jgi:hypothetical protein